MRILIDTNIIIHREASRVVIQDIGTLFYWLDKLNYEKCVHPLSIQEIRKHKDPHVVATFEAKIKSYHVLKTIAPETPQIQKIRDTYDRNDNDAIDTSLLKEVFSQRVDLLLSEDRKMHMKAAALGIADRVFTINAFLEKVFIENPDLVDYKVLAVRRAFFGNLDLNDPFFDSFKQDYKGFENWFNRKSDEVAYVCKSQSGDLVAFLYVKQEQPDENYSDIEPMFLPKKRLKIGTFKVTANGVRLGERFLKIIFDNAIRFGVQEIYMTIFENSPEQQRLVDLVKEWGFVYHGLKHSESGEEKVYVRDFSPKFDVSNPVLTYPYISRHTSKFIVSIWPEYHTELFPDSILRNESADDFADSRPNRNALRKVFVSHSRERNLKSGDVIVFYRTAEEGKSAYFSSVATTVGVVQNVVTKISNVNEFIKLCRSRSVFTDQQLAERWNRYPGYRPFIVNFLYVFSFRKRLNRQALINLGIIDQAKPIRGFEPLTDEAFRILLEHSNADKRYVVD